MDRSVRERAWVTPGLVLSGAVLLGMGASACSSGPGSTSTGSAPAGRYEPPARSYEGPGSTYEDPPAGSAGAYETPTASGGGGRASGSVGGPGLGALAPCNGTYTCTAAGQSAPATLSSAAGVCTLSVQGNLGLVLDPSGGVTATGASVGSWSGTSAQFEVTLNFDGGSLLVTCTGG